MGDDRRFLFLEAHTSSEGEAVGILHGLVQLNLLPLADGVGGDQGRLDMRALHVGGCHLVPARHVVDGLDLAEQDGPVLLLLLTVVG